MDKRSVSRRNLLAATISVVPGLVLTSAAAAAGKSNALVETVRTAGDHRLGRPRSATLQIESLDSRSSFSTSFDAVKVPFREVFGLREHTAISAPYYFDVDINRRATQSVDYDYTVSLYDTEGNDIGSITTSAGGTAVFVDQQVMFRVRPTID